MNVDEKGRFIKMEQSVEEIKTDISVIRTALVGNELSNDKGLVGGLVVVKAEIELFRARIIKSRSKTTNRRKN